MKQDRQQRTIPRFKSEDEERNFWSSHDMADFIDYFQPVELNLSALKPSTNAVTIRLSQSLHRLKLWQIKRMCHTSL